MGPPFSNRIYPLLFWILFWNSSSGKCLSRLYQNSLSSICIYLISDTVNTSVKFRYLIRLLPIMGFPLALSKPHVSKNSFKWWIFRWTGINTKSSIWKALGSRVHLKSAIFITPSFMISGCHTNIVPHSHLYCHLFLFSADKCRKTAFPSLSVLWLRLQHCLVWSFAFWARFFLPFRHSLLHKKRMPWHSTSTAPASSFWYYILFPCYFWISSIQAAGVQTGINVSA